MSWIYELSIRGSNDSAQKAQKAKNKLVEMIAKPEGRKAIFAEVAPALKSSSDAQLGLLTIFTKHLLPQLVEAKRLDSSIVDGLLKLALQLHANLLKLNSPKKIKYALKLFNKIVSRLALPERDALTQKVKTLLEKKDVAMSSWANSFTGSNRFGGQDFDQLRFKGLLANYFQEKADLASVKLFPVAFHTLTAEEFNSHFLEAFKTLYKRNSANVAKVLSFLEFFGREFFKKMSVDQLKEMLSPKIFEAINHKDEPIVISGIKTVQFFASLNKPELNDLLVQQAFPSIEKRNIELVKVMGLQLCFGLVLTSPASIKATYNLLNSALEQIKTEEYKVKLVQQFDKTSLCMAKRISSLEHLDVLLTSKGSDFNTSMRMILARHLIEVHAKEDSKMESAQESISECYTTFVQRSLVENPSRVKCGNLETLAACVLVTKFSKITGKLTAETEKIAGALASKDLEYFTEAFYKNNPPIFKSLLFELLVELDTKLKHQQKYLDIVLGSLVVDRTFCQTKILDGHKLSQAFAISCLRGVRVLYQWRGTKPHIEDFLSCSMQSLASGGTLSTEDAHTVLHVVSLQKKAVLLAQKLNSTLLQAQATSLYTNALKFPQDVLKPIDYHYLGSEGLFSLHQDKQAYYRAYVAMLINIDIDVFFKNSSIFYEEAELRDMRLVYSRNSMVCNRNLDIEDRSFTESYRDVLEHLSFLKKEKKTKKKDEPTEPEVRTIPLDYKVAGDLALKLAKEDAVYSEYAFYLRRISESAADAFSVIQESKTEKSLALMESIKQFNLFAKLKAIARDIEPLRESVQSLLEAILKGLTLSIADASFGDKFSKLYFQVISSQRATQFNRTLEELLQNIFEVKEDANIHSAAIPIIQDFSKYCFEYMYDADNRRKSYDIILCMARKEPSNFLYEFLKESLDDLYYFDGIIETLNDTVVTLGKSDKSILSGFLLKLLEYQNPAQKTFLTSVLQLDEAVMKQQDFGNFEKIKLLIVTKGESPENAGLAVQVLARIGHVLEIHQILELDFLRMVNEIPFDLHEVTGNILRDSLQKMKVSDKVSFFKMLIENCTKHTQEYTAKVKDFEDHPDDEKKQINYKEVEELLGIYPMILSCLAPIWEEEMFEPVFDMIISLENNHLPGLTQKFCDAGITFVNTHHKHSKKLLDIFEARLKHREGVVAPLVLLGAAAKFVNKKGSKLDLISDKIMGLTDSTDPVFQKKLGMNMSRLLIFFEDPAQVIEGLLSRVAEEKDTAKIRGKCFSIAGLLRGQGAVFIQKHDVLGRIQAIVKSSDKKDLKDVPKHQKYFIVYMLQALWEYFGRVFEPKFPGILPSLMRLFGDSVEELRDLSTQVLNQAMTRLSGFGVKSILPMLIEGCNDTNSRSKLSNLTALGSIAYCASKQLASSLPEIVPKLTVATVDTNPNIKEAAIKSLNQLLATIKTPEIVDIRDTLINALSRPYDENSRALEILLNTEFKHVFDTSSLALVMPIILYGLRNNRDSKQREDAAKVVAHISHLVKDAEDMTVYVPSLTEALVISLSDILPEVRATAAKAVSRLCQKLGFQHSDHLIQTLKKVIEAESSPSIERAGCAQALCEALHSFGMDQVERNFPTLLEGSVDKREHVREGFLAMFVYLPLILNEKYEKYISETLKASIESIAHQNENIRNLAIKIVKTIIQKYSDKHIDQILKSLFDGMFSDSSIKRNSSVVLLGDVIDVLMKNKPSKDQVFQENPSIFSALYIVKNDENTDVKISSGNIWKAFVDNTKVVLKKIYPVLTRQLIELMITGVKYHTEISSLTMDVFISKYSDVFINEIIELLKSYIAEGNPKVCKGICLFLNDTFTNINDISLSSSRKKNFERLIAMLVANSDESVWRTAVDSIHEYYKRAKDDEFIKDLLTGYAADLNEKGDEEEELGKKIKVFVKICQLGIPKLNAFMESLLFTSPILPWQLEVIANTAKVYGSKMYMKGMLRSGLMFFVEQYLEQTKTPERGELLLYTMKQLVENLSEEHEGMFVTQTLDFLKKYIANKEGNLEVALLALALLSQFYEYNSPAENQYLGNIVENLIPFFIDDSEGTKKIFPALGQFLKTKVSVLSRQECASCIETVKYALMNAFRKKEALVGLDCHEVFEPFFGLVSSSIIVGDRRICTIGLDCLEAIIKGVSIGTLQANSNKILGLLIRVCSYRHDEITKSKLMSLIALQLTRITLDEAQASQVSTLIVYLANEKTDSDDYFAELEELITVLNSRCTDKLAIVRRWAKRAICDSRFSIGKLLKYMMTDSDLKELTSRVQSAVDSKDCGAIDNLAF